MGTAWACLGLGGRWLAQAAESRASSGQKLSIKQSKQNSQKANEARPLFPCKCCSLPSTLPGPTTTRSRTKPRRNGERKSNRQQSRVSTLDSWRKVDEQESRREVIGDWEVWCRQARPQAIRKPAGFQASKFQRAARELKSRSRTAVGMNA